MEIYTDKMHSGRHMQICDSRHTSEFGVLSLLRKKCRPNRSKIISPANFYFKINEIIPMLREVYSSPWFMLCLIYSIILEIGINLDYL